MTLSQKIARTGRMVIGSCALLALAGAHPALAHTHKVAHAHKATHAHKAARTHKPAHSRTVAVARKTTPPRETGPRSVSELLVNASNGAVLYSELPDAPRRPASLTKMMTLYLLFDALDAGKLRLGDSLPVSRNAARQPASKLGIVPGTTLPVRTAITAMAVHSANDVTVAVAERLAGSESKFAELMTAKARQLGMAHTRFANASGLTNTGNETTARDMARLALALLKNHARYYSVFSTRSMQWRTQRIFNHDHLLGKVTGVDGIKTGYTVDAGFNIATSAKRGGVRIVAVVLGAKTLQARDLRVANLVELGFTPSAGARPRRTTR